MPVNKNRHGRWYYDLPASLSPSGKRSRIVVPTARNKKQATDAERKAIQQIHEGKYGTPAGSMLLRDYVTKHYEPWTRLNKRSWRIDMCRLKPIVAFFGELYSWLTTPADDTICAGRNATAPDRLVPLCRNRGQPRFREQNA